MTVAHSEDAGGDTARFTSIYRRNYTRVLGSALAHSPREAAEDVANETFLTAWRKLDEIPQDDPLPWLLGAARNHRLKQPAGGWHERCSNGPPRRRSAWIFWKGTAHDE